MHTDARLFVDALFARCAANNFITLTALPPTPDLPTPSRHVRMNDTATLTHALERLACANAGGWSGVVGVATRRADLGRWRRGGKGDLSALPALFVDIDDTKGVAARIANSPTPPSCIVASGHGLHLYFYLTKPTCDWALSTRLLKGMTAYFNGDPVISIAQSIRLPGTMNCKPGKPATPCHILDHRPVSRYTLDELSRAFHIEPVTVPRIIPSRQHGDTAWNTANIGDPNPALVQEVMQCLIMGYGGQMQANGWLAARCPCGHRRDGVGAHFGFNPAWGMGVCFGRHGRLRLIDLCPLLGIDLHRYEWVSAKQLHNGLL
jgi:hypothetical protein